MQSRVLPCCRWISSPEREKSRLGGGAIDLLEFEEPRHLKIAKKTINVQGENKESRTACLTVVSSIEIKKEKEGQFVTIKCKAVVGMPSTLTLDREITDCKIVVGREAVHQVALTGSFVGCHFELVGKSKDKTSGLGKLLFKEQKPAVMPRFVFQNQNAQKNSVQASYWGKLAIEWMNNSSASIPVGSLNLTVSRAPEKNHTYITLGKIKATLINFSHEIKDLIAYPVSMGSKNLSQRYIFLFKKDGKLVGVLGLDDQGIPKGVTPRATKDPIGRVLKDWNSFAGKAKEVWSTNFDL